MAQQTIPMTLRLIRQYVEAARRSFDHVRRSGKAPLMAGCVLMLTVGHAWSQTTTGIIAGTVSDSSQGRVPGVTVVLTNSGTGLTVTEVTDASGTYRVTNLPLGSYEIKAELPGFRASTRSGVVLTVGREAIVNFTLELGELTDEIVVTGDAPLIESTNAAMQSLVNEDTIRQLPLNARDYVQLATLQSGVNIVAGLAHGDPSRTTQRGNGINLSISGGRPHQNAFTLDGMDVNDYANSTPGSASGNNLGVDAIQEFVVLSNSFSAEYGRVGGGGVINAITKSGTNSWRGTAYYFHRNDALDAPDYFDRGGSSPDFVRHQGGASIGGPLLRNRLFIFGNHERLRENLGATFTDDTLTQQGREGRLSTGTVTVDPVVAPYLAFYPLPNGQIFEGGDIGEFIYPAQRETVDDYYTLRGDYYLNDAHRLFARFTRDEADITAPGHLGLIENNSTSRTQYATVQHTWIISSNLISVSGVGVNQNRGTTGDNNPLDPRLNDVSLGFIPGHPPGRITVSGINEMPGGPRSFEVEFFDQTLFQFKQDFSWTRGPHLVKFGGNIETFQTDQDATANENAVYSFQSIAEFLTNRPFNITTIYPGSDTVRDWRQKLIGLYIQNDLRLTSTLSLNAGVRYEFFTDPVEANGKMSNLRDLQDPEVTVGKLWKNPSLKNFSPRVGVSWDPTGSGRTVIRGGGGVFHDPLLFHYFTGTGVRMPPFFRRGTLRLQPGDFPVLGYQRFVDVGPQGTVTLDPFPYDIPQPTRAQLNFNVQHELLPNWVVQVGLVGGKGWNESRLAQYNIPEPEIVDGRYFFPQGAPRRNPAFGNIRHRFMDGESFYSGLQLVTKKRFANGTEMQVSYDWSKTINDDAAFAYGNQFDNTATTPYPFQVDFSRGLAEFHVEHKFRANFSLEPFARSQNRFMQGWRVGGIVAAASGSPFTVGLGFDRAGLQGTNGQRPDLADGASNNPVLGSPDKWFDDSVFLLPERGFLGNVGRGTLIGPNRVSVDVSVTNRLPLGANRSVELRFEVFNLFDHANFYLPGNTSIFSSSGRLPNRGVITRTATPARQIQLGAKFAW